MLVYILVTKKKMYFFYFIFTIQIYNIYSPVFGVIYNFIIYLTVKLSGNYNTYWFIIIYNLIICAY